MKSETFEGNLRPAATVVKQELRLKMKLCVSLSVFFSVLTYSMVVHCGY